MKNDNIKIKRTFIADEAYELLSNLIIRGELAPNTKLKINELTKDLGISSTPIREALLRLEREGLVLTKANQRTIVAPINLKEANNIYPLIYQLESYAIKDGYENINDDFITQLSLINEQIKLAFKSKDKINVLNLDNDFHAMIINLSDNDEILPMIDNLKKRLMRIELYFFDKNVNEFTTYKEHADIIEGFKSRDLERSLSALKTNWNSTLGSITEDKES